MVAGDGADVDLLSSNCLSSFFVSSSSDFFGFLGAPNAFSQALRFGVADLSTGVVSAGFTSGFFGFSFSFSSISFRASSFAISSVDVIISSNSMSSESLSLDPSSLSCRSPVKRK